MTDTLNWKHMVFSGPDDARLIRRESGLPDIIADALFDADSRPRMLQADGGVLVILGGCQPEARLGH
jgi:hypothetical protein